MHATSLVGLSLTAALVGGATNPPYDPVVFKPNSPWIYKITKGATDLSPQNAKGLWLTACKDANPPGAQGDFGPYWGVTALYCRSPVGPNMKDYTADALTDLNAYLDVGVIRWEIEATAKHQ